MATRANIERRIENLGYGFTETSSMEKANQGESEGMRWRVFSKNERGYGYAGGSYFKTLADVDEWLSLQEERMNA
jgi:hypothetical protein